MSKRMSLLAICLIIGTIAVHQVVATDWGTLAAQDAAGEVLEQIESFYGIYGLSQTHTYCNDAGVFHQEGLYFRCTANTGSSFGSDGYYSTQHNTVFVYADSTGAWPGEGLTFVQRVVLRVPYVPTTSKAWGPRIRRTGL